MNKTVPTTASVDAFLDAVTDPKRRADARTVAAWMTEATGVAPRMWGTSIVGFGERHYVYETGREGDWFELGFSPRKANLVLYVLTDEIHCGPLLGKLGKHKTGNSCLYIRALADIDADVLREILAASVAVMRQRGAT